MNLRTAHRGLVLPAAALLLLAAAPLAEAGHGTTVADRVLCGTVVNEAGWPLAGVTIQVVGIAPNSADHIIFPLTSGPDGYFQATILGSRYQFLFVDTLPPEQRAGASYAPRALEVTGVGVAGSECRGQPSSKRLPDVVLDAPHVGFVEVVVRDAAVGAAGRVAGSAVAVKVPAVGPLPAGAGAPPEITWGTAVSDAAGLARVTCPLQAPARVQVAKADFDGAVSASFPCQDRGLTVDLYRSPVTLRGDLTDADNAAAAPAGVAVTAAPRAFAPLAGAGNPYVLTTATNGASYTLKLPWGDTFDVTASKTGYAPGTAAVSPAPADIAGGLERDFALGRAAFPVSGRVEDVFGAAVAQASLSFQGRSGLAFSASATSGNDGTFSRSLLFGSYDVTITAAQKNVRACTLTLDEAGKATFAPASCLRLVRSGSGALQGRVLDELRSLGVPGVTVQVNGDTALTDGNGNYLFEVPQGPVTVSFSHGDYQTAVEPRTIALDAVQDAGARTLLRTHVSLALRALDDGGSNVGAPGGVAGAVLCVDLLKAGGGVEAKGCPAADAAGQASISLPWTASPGLGAAFDAGDYRVKGRRNDAAPIYDDQTCVAATDLAPGAAASRDCPLRAVDGVATPLGPFTDAHTGLALPGVSVTASSAGVPCEAPYACSATSGAGGAAALLLPAGRTYTLAASRDGYQAPASLAGVSPGSPAFADRSLARTARDLEVQVLDAHTLGMVAGAELEAAAAFTCDPGFGGFACSATADEEGLAMLRLPWGAFTLQAAAGELDVAQREETEADVAFLDGARVLVLASTDGDAALDPPLRLLRAPGEPITAAVRDHLAQPTSAVLTATLEREGFDCQPAEHDGPALDYGDCAFDAAVSEASLTMPHGTLATHTWTLEAGKGGHFTEVRTGVPLGGHADFDLWPLTFDLVVDPRDPLTGQTVPETSVCILNLDQVAQALPSVPVERCLTNGPLGGPVTFPGVTWLRNDLDGDGALFGMDEGDTFSVRASQFEHVGQFVGPLGPAATRVTVEMAPLFPTFDATDGDGDGFPASLEVALRTDPGDAASHPLNDGTLRNDLNDGHSLFLEATGAQLLAPGLVGVAPAHGSFAFRFGAERYPTHLLGAAEPVPAPAGTPVAFAVFDASFATRLAVAAATGGAPQPWREHALLLLEGTVGDGTFASLPGGDVGLTVQADALPFAGEPVVPWAWVRAGDTYETPVSLGPAQPASGYFSLARNAARGTALADKLDWALTPVVLAASSQECREDLFEAQFDTATLDCEADSVEGSLAARLTARANAPQNIVAVSAETTELPGTPLGTHRVGVTARPNDAMATLSSALDTDGDGAATADELMDGRDPTAPADDAGFPAALGARAADFLQARAAELAAWLGA